MKNLSRFFAALVAVLFSVAETSAQITPPYYNPAKVNITGGNINGTVIGASTKAAAGFTTVTSSGTGTNYGQGIQQIQNNDSTKYWTQVVASNSRLFFGYSSDSGSNYSGALSLGSSGTEILSGKLTVGSGNGTNAGLIAGYSGVSGYGSLWSTGVTPSASNYSYSTNGSTTAINASVNTHISVVDTPIATATSTLFTSQVPIRLKGYTVATLPAAGTAGRMAYVTDATAPTYNGALVGGGAVVIPVFDNGSAWVAH